MTMTMQVQNDSGNPGHAWAVLNAERQELCADLNAGARPLREAGTRLNLIDAAMDRLLDGRYGRCLKCFGPIEQKLLAADPALTTCYSCQTGIETEHTIA